MKLDRFDAAVALALVSLCFAIYAPSFDFGFVDFDDNRYVTEHRLVLGGLDFESAAKAFTRTKAHGASVLDLDSDFARFPELSCENPLVP